MSASSVLLNDRLCPLSGAPARTVLDWLRLEQGIRGTKEACGEGECGACTVLLGDGASYRTVASCLLPVGELAGRHLVTIEGLDPAAGLSPIQQALVDEGAPQCGFCFPGIVVALTGFFLTSRDLSERDAIDAIDGNICRCTGYTSIRRAVTGLCQAFAPRLDPAADRVAQLVAWGIVPPYFAQAGAILGAIVTDTTAAPGDACPEDALFVSGGTDLLVQQPPALRTRELSFLSRRPSLRRVARDGDHLVIGGGVTVEDLRHLPELRALVPDIDMVVTLFASTIIRNRATVAGNLVNASPIGDVTVLLLALGSVLQLTAGTQTRLLPLSAFYRGYKTLDLGPGEIVTSVHLPLSVADACVHFEKVSQRRHLDIAAVNSALCARCVDGVLYDVRLAVGGVAPVPLLANATMAYLERRAVTAAGARDAADVLVGEIAPISDVRGSADYKRALACRLLYAHLLAVAPDRLRVEELV